MRNLHLPVSSSEMFPIAIITFHWLATGLVGLSVGTQLEIWGLFCLPISLLTSPLLLSFYCFVVSRQIWKNDTLNSDMDCNSLDFLYMCINIPLFQPVTEGLDPQNFMQFILRCSVGHPRPFSHHRNLHNENIQGELYFQKSQKTWEGTEETLQAVTGC